MRVREGESADEEGKGGWDCEDGGVGVCVRGEDEGETEGETVRTRGGGSEEQEGEREIVRGGMT